MKLNYDFSSPFVDKKSITLWTNRSGTSRKGDIQGEQAVIEVASRR